MATSTIKNLIQPELRKGDGTYTNAVISFPNGYRGLVFVLDSGANFMGAFLYGTTASGAPSRVELYKGSGYTISTSGRNVTFAFSSSSGATFVFFHINGRATISFS